MKRDGKKKNEMKCGEVKESDRKGKKIMKKYCSSNGEEKIVHAGQKGYGNNYSDVARNSFRARHKCSEAKEGTPKHLACTELWKKGGRKTSPPKQPTVTGAAVLEPIAHMKCWDGYKKVGEKPGTGRNKGKMVNDCKKI